MYSPPEFIKEVRRTFSENAVLTMLDDLAEVGAGGTVSATPSAGALPAIPALERDMAVLDSSQATSGGAHAGSKSGNAKGNTFAP
jgi:hypothetical protein